MFRTRTLPNELSHELATTEDLIAVDRLGAGSEIEVLEFLSQRAIHTVAMTGLIADNGLDSRHNRGKFYGCRDLNGRLEGVALVGHATLLETVSDRALAALAQVAQQCPNTHLIMGEKERVADFWGHYAAAGRQHRLACREWLFELSWPIEAREQVQALRRATAAELELVMPVQAQLAFAESGISPLQMDPQGFRARCVRRIEQGRTWVVVENDSLIFKADVISRTSKVNYVEGIWMREDHRANGSGLRYMSDLMRRLLKETKSICLLVNETNKPAQNFYRKCGFHFRATYETIFLPRMEPAQN